MGCLKTYLKNYVLSEDKGIVEGQKKRKEHIEESDETEKNIFRMIQPTMNIFLNNKLKNKTEKCILW